MASPTNNINPTKTNDEVDGSISLPNSPSSLSSSSDTTAMGSGRGNEYLPLNVAEDSHNRSSDTRRINRRALLTFLGVLVVVVAIVALTVIFVAYSGDKGDHGTSTKQSRDKRRYTFNDIFDGKFYADMPDEKWISDDTLISVDHGNVITHDVSSGKKDILFTNTSLGKLGIDDVQHYFLSPDKSWMLFMLESTKKYRYSTVGKYIAVKIDSNESIKISTSGTDTFSPIQYISWGGDSNSIVFVSDNDIYWKKNVDDSNAVRITTTGKEKILFNGIPDWVYEEEILENRPSVIVSPDEKHLCYASFNDTNVPLFEISLYGDEERAYTRIEDIAYPKPGFPNPDVHIYIYNVDNDKKTEIYPPKDISQSDFYFTNLVWANSNTVSVTWLNRAQNTSVVMLCSVDGSCIENYSIDVDDGWISQSYLDPLFSDDGSYYIQVCPKTEGKDGDFLHVAVVSSTKNANKDVKFLTSGTWEVRKIVSFDEKNGLIYYQSSETSYTQVHLYSVNMKGEKECLTCKMNETKSGHCHVYSSSFSKKCSWYTLNCRGPLTPMSWIQSTTGKKAIVLEKNEELQEAISRILMPTFKYSRVDTTDGQYGLVMRELRPPDFDENKKYAVLFNVYGGPGSQEIMETFQTSFHTYLTSNFDVIVCEVDGRGTASRGRKFVHAVHSQLGVFERDDTLAAAKYMQSKKYVDPDKISIWGWSYGGFLSSFILSTQEERTFGSAVAVAPVTDWRYYDSIYTERFMGQPSKDDNLIGYEYSSVLKHAASIPDDSFLVVHGTGDDNVHFQNSAQLIKVLTEAGVKFDMQIYTDKHHALEGLDIQKHLYNRLTDFFKEKLRL